jgi:cytoskeletal protein CcmA (bactofilin family)
LFIDGLLILRESSKIYGDIQTVKLHMEEGAVFEGACKMGNSVSPQVAATSNLNAEDIIY